MESRPMYLIPLPKPDPTQHLNVSHSCPISRRTYWRPEVQAVIALTPRLWVRISLNAWMFVVVYSSTSLTSHPIIDTIWLQLLRMHRKLPKKYYFRSLHIPTDNHLPRHSTLNTQALEASNISSRRLDVLTEISVVFLALSSRMPKN